MLYLIKNEETQTETNYLAQAYTTTNGSRVSPKYQHIQTSEIYDAISSMGFQVTSSKAHGKKVSAHSRHITTFEHPLDLGNGMKPRVIVDNSHDGSRACYVRFGAFRLVCSNGLVMGNDIIKPIRIAHKGNQEKITERIYEFVAQAKTAMAEMLERMTKTELTENQFVSFAKRAHVLRYKSEAGFEETLYWARQVKRESDEGMSLWVVYNRVQEALEAGTKARSRRLRSETRKVDFNNELNNLAMEYALAA
jgi:hypothetical protein